MANDLKLKHTAAEQALKSAGSGIPAQAPPQGHKYTYDELLQKYESLKYSYNKIDLSRVDLEKQLAENKAMVDKKNGELDSLYQDNASVYEQYEEVQKKRSDLEAKMKQLEENNLILGKAQIQLRQEISDTTFRLTNLTAEHRNSMDKLSLLE